MNITLFIGWFTEDGGGTFNDSPENDSWKNDSLENQNSNIHINIVDFRMFVCSLYSYLGKFKPYR